MSLWRKFFNIFYPFFGKKLSEGKNRAKAPGVSRSEKNPAICPIFSNDWEAEGTFNPAAILIDGRAHVLYRAVGRDGISRIGYASSKDGINFDERLSFPIFSMPRKNSQCLPGKVCRYDPVIYPSGGSWGGCEDPRMVLIENKVHVTFNAFDGWDFIRIGVITLDKEDFLKKKWNWSYPLFLSPEGEVHKNWVLFPEKINGKFAILHSITPELQIDYVDKLEDLADGSSRIKSHFAQKMGKKTWDTWVRGAGAPPIKTDAGWLVFYHGVERDEPSRYKVGVMLLDLKDPNKIIAYSRVPILAPDMHYENDWKPGVVYVCGAIIKDGELFIYYGGGDKYTCVASAPVDKFVDELKKGHKVSVPIMKKIFK